jgi:hypothetical protein
MLRTGAEPPPVWRDLACKAALKSATQQAGFCFPCRVISPMPRFYFDLLVGSASNCDEAGYEIGSMEAAEIEARRSAGELARERLLTVQSGTSEDIRIEVKDLLRQPVFTVTVSIQVERTELISSFDV